jgi:hypothetical protein
MPQVLQTVTDKLMFRCLPGSGVRVVFWVAVQVGDRWARVCGAANMAGQRARQLLARRMLLETLPLRHVMGVFY